MSRWLMYAMPALPGLALLVDDIRLRLLRRGDLRAARAAELLARSGGTVGTCLEAHEGYCRAHASAVCADGRCRAHCRIECRCPGNR